MNRTNRLSNSFWRAALPIFFLVMFGAASPARAVYIDLLVVYTPSLENDYGGYDGVEALVRASVESSNISFENSNIDIELRLIGLRKVDYQEDNDDMSVDLDHLRNLDGVIDETRTWRNEVGADVIYMFRSDSYDIDHIGQAWILEDEGGEESYAYGVVTGEYVLSGLVLQHEIGHNLGAAHDPDNTDNGGLFSYSYGHRFTISNVTYRSVMAYAPGYEINYFSSPNIKYEGVATGTSQRDNARTLRNTAATVAGYRSFKPSKPTAVADYDDSEWIEDTDNNGYEMVTLDGSGSRGWPSVESWNWSWPGGSASGETVDAKLPLGTNTVTLTITGVGGLKDSVSVQVTVHGFSPIENIFTTQQGLFLQKADGRTTAAGYNGDKLMGVETNQSSITTLTKIKFDNLHQVSGKGSQTLFLLKDGSVYGTGYYWNQNFPDKAVEGFTKIFDGGIVSVASGSSHSLFLDDKGKVWGAGSNYDGQLGGGPESPNSTELSVIFDSGAKAIRAGQTFSSIIGTDGSLWVSGKVRYDPFAGVEYSDHRSFTKIEQSGVVAFDSGDEHIVYLKEDGSVWTTGYNREGQLGTGDQDRRVDQAQKIVDTGAASVEAGSNNTYVTMNDGTIWGAGYGLISPQAFRSENAYELQPIFSSRVQKISASYNLLAVLLKDGSVWVGGRNDYGQLGQGYTSHQMSPLLQTTPVTDLSQPNGAPTARGKILGYPIDDDGDGFATVNLDASDSSDDWRIESYLWTLPEGSSNEQKPSVLLPVGESSFTLTVFDDQGLQHSQDFIVEVKPYTRPKSVYASQNRFFIIKEDGSLWCAGDVDDQFFGFDYTEYFFEKPTPVMASDVVKVVGGSDHCIVLKNDGSVWGTGSNSHGQLGLGEQLSSNGFVEIWPSGATDIAAAAHMSLILLDDGTAYGMGQNYQAQIADSAADLVHSPHRLPLEGIRELATSGYNSILLLEDGRIVRLQCPTEERTEPFIEIVQEGGKHLEAVNSNLLLYIDQEDRVSHRSLGSYAPYFGNYLVEPGFAFDTIIDEGVLDIQLRNEKPLVVDANGASYTFGQSYSRSYRFPLSKYQKDDFFFSSVEQASAYDDLAIFLLQDGSVWLSTDNYRFGQGTARNTIPSLISEPFETSQNIAPIANVVYPEKTYLLPGTPSKMVTLDGSGSTDDKFIKSWLWSWDNNTANRPILSEYFDVGTTEVTLAVTDSEGLFHTKTVTVTVEENSEIASLSGSSSANAIVYRNGYALMQGYTASTAVGQAHSNNGRVYGHQVTLGNIEQLENASNTTGLIDKESALWLTGNNTNGEMGIGYKSSLEPFHKVIPENVVDFSLTNDASFACLSDGSLWATGLNRDSRFASDSIESSDEWLQIIESGVSQVETDGSTVYIMKEDGSVWMFGRNQTFDSSSLPYNAIIVSPIQILESKAEEIFSSSSVILVTKQDGSLWGAGSNNSSKLGLPLNVQRSNQFVKLSNGPVAKARSVGNRTIWLMEDGSLWGVGSSYNRLLGLGNTDRYTAIMDPLALFRSGIRDFSLSNDATVVLTDDGSIYSTEKGDFGYNDSSTNYSSTWHPLSSVSKPQGNASPVANAGKDSLFYTTHDYGHVYLDGTLSQDDWAIEKWQWDLNGYQLNSALTEAYLNVGIYTATLTVTDFFGNTSSDTVKIELRQGSAFDAWLRTYLSEEQIDALNEKKNSDFDQDGHSNYIEFLFQTDPASKNSKASLGWLHSSGYLFLDVFGSSAYGDLPILMSTDLIHWSPWDGAAVDLQSNGPVFLKISDQQY
ncbi:M12 family metallo-peptidase [Pelagicoccus sp. SDUM812002]|uniref:M12 family metallo-peptidase n=1 Tax=Pelagicoccus sp. SDUM812002 TaxID=3041266 RepID=UPI0028106537|nr:M12 family metallo-peptidase [Pelagicoccus sp. SDUM812002]MDQ8184727.1 M12 family metallo-peptidase [Pelagicoccus sp. SDUM812002]